MNPHRVGRWEKSAMVNARPPNFALIRGAFWCGRRNRSSRSPSSCMTSKVEGWIVSPRKSRRKSSCFSSTTTSTPARASNKPNIIPAGPPPATQQRVDAVSCCLELSAPRAPVTGIKATLSVTRHFPFDPRPTPLAGHCCAIVPALSAKSYCSPCTTPPS